MTTRTGSEMFSNEVSLVNPFLKGFSFRKWFRNAIDRVMTVAGRRQVVAETGKIELNALENAVEQLQPTYRVIYGLHDVYGCGFEEIAEKLGISASDARSQLHAARLQLRSLMFQR